MPEITEGTETRDIADERLETIGQSEGIGNRGKHLAETPDESSELPEVVETPGDFDRIDEVADATYGWMEANKSRWPEMDSTERHLALTHLEDSISRAQGRPPTEIRIEDQMEDRLAGQFDPETGEIRVNANQSLEESARTVVHEGRHAYQYHCRETDVPHPLRPGWDANMAEGAYIRPEVSFPRYRGQPVEADAFGYENRVFGVVDTLKEQQ